MISEPYKIKTVRHIPVTNFQDRIDILTVNGYNTFNIPSSYVTYDMTSQGTSAMSQEQFSGFFVGDETYAGSRNFEALVGSVKSIFNMNYVCPTHNLIGSNKLIAMTMIDNEKVVYSNSDSLNDLMKGRGTLKNLHKINSNDALVYIDLYSNGFEPFPLNELKDLYNRCAHVVVNFSHVVSYVNYVRDNVPDYKDKTIKDLVSLIASFAHVIVMDAGQDSRCNSGGLIATNDCSLYEKYMNEVIVYEGLQTYGGMAGRTMEIFARGIREMVYEKQANWIYQQVKHFSKRLVNIPHKVGPDGIYIEAAKFFTNDSIKFLTKDITNPAQTLAAALYLKSGVRAFLLGKDEDILPVQIPRMAFTNGQLDEIADIILELYSERNKISPLILQNDPKWNDESTFKWKRPIINDYIFKNSPLRIQQIEYMGEGSREERIKYIKDAGHNTFLLQSKHVTLDLLTDSGTTAQSVDQWMSYIGAVDSIANPDSFHKLVDVLKQVTGYKYIIPTHQGRAAEHIMSQCLIRDKSFVPGNMYFTTTKLHQELAGGTFADIICDEAHNPTNTFRWKGNIDITKLEKLVNEHGSNKIPYISFEMSVNLAGGEPVHMDNARDVYEYCEDNNIYVMWDATRAIENAYMIKKYDPRYKLIQIKDIVHELFSYGHGATVSSKKDYLVNIGGFLAIKDDEKFYHDALDMIRIYEGTVTTGGLSSGDLAAHAIGAMEMLDFSYIENRVEQTKYLGDKLLAAGIPIVEPIGSHAIFLDAKRFLDHINQENYPAQALATALYIDSGIRAMERGNVSSGRKKNGENYCPSLELVRLTISRRVYTNSHMDLIANSVINLYERRREIKGLRFVYEPQYLRFFQGRFEEIDSF